MTEREVANLLCFVVRGRVRVGVVGPSPEEVYDGLVVFKVGDYTLTSYWDAGSLDAIHSIEAPGMPASKLEDWKQCPLDLMLSAEVAELDRLISCAPCVPATW